MSPATRRRPKAKGSETAADGVSAPVILEQYVDAPAGDVFVAFTEGESLRRWWSAWPGCPVESASIDARRGGRYRVEGREINGVRGYFEGDVLEVDGTFMAFTWAFSSWRVPAPIVYFHVADVRGQERSLVQLEVHGFERPNDRAQAEFFWRRVLVYAARGIPRLDEKVPPPEVQAFLASHPTWRARRRG